MKKFLVMLMVVAMASFLFVGCIPGVTPVTPEPEPEPEPVVPTTVTPVITAVAGISLTGTAEYINAAEAAVVIVDGTAPTYSEVKVYVDGVTAGTGDTGITGTFSVVIAEADLGADGAKTLYATAIETGLAESAHSVEYTFTLDQDFPGIAEVKATAAAALAVTTVATAVSTPVAASTAINNVLTVIQADVEDGTWTIDVLDASAGAAEVRITDPVGDLTTYAGLTAGDIFVVDAPIPGVSFRLKLATAVTTGALATTAFADNGVAADTITLAADPGFAVGDVILVTGSTSNDGAYTIDAIAAAVLTLVATDALTNEAAGGVDNVTCSPLIAGQQTTIVCTARVQSAAIAGRATLKYDEDVSYAAATAATCVYGGNLLTPAFAAYKESNDTYYFTGITGPAVYLTAQITVRGVADLAGNVAGTVASPLSATCTVGVASATALAP